MRTGSVSDEDLDALYRGADVFAYPSLYEGFGLPVLEAMARGVPTLASDASSLPEVAGDAALLVDPDGRRRRSRKALARLLTETALADELRQRGLQRAATFTWAATAARYARRVPAADGSVDVVKVSLISTVKDASAHVEEFVGSVAGQTRAPDEVIVVDGGSTDGKPTCSAGAGAITVIEERGANIARGRNVAIAAGAHDVIAVTDADCVLDPTGSSGCSSPIEAGADVAMGFYPRSPRVPPGVHGVGEPPTRRLGRRSRELHAERALGRVPARFDRGGRRLPGVAGIGEDMWVNHRWRELGLDMRFAPDAVVRWRLRPTLRATWAQYFRYARGDAQAAMFPERHALRFGVYARRRCGARLAHGAGRRRWRRPEPRRTRASRSAGPGAVCRTLASAPRPPSSSPR